ncbi:SusC/RagA family TonB-linked outer membrane protein [Sphingobacterium humi]|nr:SusC/RagA family TonB-linked outer membrane protein [Sphingobacterium humi]
MKITTFLLLVFMSCVYAEGTAQNVSLALKNAKLEHAFQLISKQTKYKFLYSDDVLKYAPSVSLNVSNSPLREVLDQLLNDKNYSFKIIANTITVNYKTDSKPVVVTGYRAQQHRVTGTVKGSDGKALANASIEVKGGTAGTTSNETGAYSLNAPANATLVVRYVGYKSKEVAVDGRTSIHIILDSQDQALDAVEVVATGYQTLDRKLFTGATTKVNAKDAERAGVPDISRMLEGQAAGVSVQNVSGTFGAAPKIRVRGATSLSGDNKPLWVVDGIILEDIVNISNEALSTGDANTLIGSSVAGLNPNDIESMTILKDAAATAMYGARAMNGVIVVTTKRGVQTDGAPQINLNSTLTTYLKPNYNQFDIMNSGEQMSVLMEMERKGAFSHGASKNMPNGGIFYKMYNQIYDYNAETDTYSLKNDEASKNAFLKRYADANTDWFDLLFKNSLLQEHSLSFNSGTSKAQTYASTSFTNDSGQTLGDKVKRYTANLRTNFKMSDKFSGEILVNGSIRDQRTPGTLTRNSDPVFGQYSRDFDINPFSYSLNTSRLMTAYDENGNLEYFQRNFAPFNIINELENNYLELGMNELKVQAGFKYKFIKNFTYSADGSYRYAKTTRKHYIKENSNMVKAYQAHGMDPYIMDNNRFLFERPFAPTELPYVVLPEGGFYNTNSNDLVNYYFRHNLEYDATINTDHRVNVFGSMELRYTDRQYDSFDGVGYQYENSGIVNPDYKYFERAQYLVNPYFSMGYTKDRFVAYALRAAYAYAGKYSMNFTTRYDGSNLMGSSKTARWLPTWNISGAWDLDQESFFNADNPIISGARIRGTYGLVASLGNARNSDALFYNRLTYRPTELDKETLIGISSLANSGLTWEKLYETNLGADLSLFHNKIDLTVDLYKRDIFDLISTVTTSGIGGQFRKVANAGKMSGKGIEATIGGSPIKNDDFRWRTSFNFAINKNKITELEVNPNIWTLIRAEGGPLLNYDQRGLFSIKFNGLDPEYGFPRFVNQAGNETATRVDFQSTSIDYLKYHGPVDPVTTGGFYNQFAYKNLTLSVLFTFGFGNYVRLQPSFSPYLTDDVVMSRDMVNRWMMPGDEAKTTIPTILDPLVSEFFMADDPRYSYFAYNYSDQRVAKGDFIRFKNISLSYRLPQSITDRLKMRNMEVALVGNNVALLYSDKKLNGADPEFFGNGGVALPIPRQYTFSLKMGF